MIYVMAFLGGVLLNFMPCTLPVIALKVMSRERPWWYVAGMLSVFMALATLSVVVGLAWGAQFNYTGFNITLISVTFVMGLAYLGVWELPSFGFRDRGGAFAKGAFTTILATPCSGPFLGPVFAATLGQPPLTVYAIFGSIGLGMAAPYIGVTTFGAYIPKPGNWMVTFKQLAGFALIATTLWLLHAIDQQYLFPTLVLLLGLAIGCWAWSKNARISAMNIALSIGIIGFNLPMGLDWQRYDDGLLEQVRGQKIVLVEFSAPWCLTCQVNEATLGSDRVRQVIEANGVVPMRAYMPNGESQLRQLGYKSVPVLAIYPLKGEPIVLPDLVSKGDVVAAIKLAAIAGQPALPKRKPAALPGCMQ